MNDAYLCDSIRTPFGRYGGSLASVRTDDLAAIPLRALLARNAGLDPAAIDDVILGCANQAGEDNRNVFGLTNPHDSRIEQEHDGCRKKMQLCIDAIRQDYKNK